MSERGGGREEGRKRGEREEEKRRDRVGKRGG